MIEFQLCIRNQAFNRKPGEKDDWCTRGIESKALSDLSLHHEIHNASIANVVVVYEI
jgi:hypothetical protein